MDDNKIAKQFSKAAKAYEAASALPRIIGDSQIERLQGIRLKVDTILNLESKTGDMAHLLQKIYPKASVIGQDASLVMLEHTKRRQSVRQLHWVNAEIRSLPFAAANFDLICANFMTGWDKDFVELFNEWFRVLKPGGLLLFTLLGRDTLKELKACDSPENEVSSIPIFPDMHEIGDALLQASFCDSVMDVEYFTLLYTKFGSLMRDIKTLRNQTSFIPSSKGLTGKKSLYVLEQAYQAFRTEAGKLPATCEIIYGHAWVPKIPKKTRNGANEISIAIDQIAGRKSKIF